MDAFFMPNNKAIGFFDSGVGGLTIWNEIVKSLPYEDTIYIADSVNAPYGIKSKHEVQELSIQNTERLIELGAKLIVVACNTATTQSIQILRKKYDIPFIGIEPAIKPAALKSKTRTIGVLATHGTLESEHFHRTKDKFTADVTVQTQVGEGLVNAIESGLLNTTEIEVILKKHLDVLHRKPIDFLVLGCTHYPLLIPAIKNILGSKIEIIDSGKAVARQTKSILEENGMLSDTHNEGQHHLYTTGNIGVLKSITKELGYSIDQKEIYYSYLYQSE
jgi:glutamate racemase